MSRERISTTVDRDRLAMCRRLVGASDSKLIDRALSSLLDAIEAEREQEALDAMPYETDPELSWVAPSGPDLPYDGEIPDVVKHLARTRQRREKV